MYKISQTELAKVLNTTQQQISLYENQKRKLNEDQIATLIKVYHAEIGDLLELGAMEEKKKRNKIIDLERIKQSEKGTRLFLAGSLFFCNYLKLYPMRTQKTDAKANKQQSKAPSRESDIGQRKER